MNASHVLIAVAVLVSFGIHAQPVLAEEKAIKNKLQIEWAKPKEGVRKEPVTSIPNVEYRNLVRKPIKDGYTILSLIAVGQDGKPQEYKVEGKNIDFSEGSGTIDMIMNNFVIGTFPSQGYKLYGVGTATYTIYETSDPKAPTIENSTRISNKLSIKYSLDQR